MLQPGRSYSAASSYRYGFNGKENDNEVKGEGNQLDYKMRIYDPRLGRFLSVDPIADEYPQLTPYQFASNQPIESVDMDGLERWDFRALKGEDGKAKLTFVFKGPKEWDDGGFLGTGWMEETHQIAPQIRIEYNGQHYMFADGRQHENVVNIPSGSGHGVYGEGLYYMADYYKFIEDPDAFTATHKSQEKIQREYDFVIGVAELVDETVNRPSPGKPSKPRMPRPRVPITPKPGTSTNKPAGQQKVATTPNTIVQKNVTQNNTILKPLNRGSTGRTTAKNLNEKLTMEEIMSNPNLGSRVPALAPLNDSRWKGWYKMQYIKNLGDGTKINVHYNAQIDKSGKITAVDDFKFKDHK